MTILLGAIIIGVAVLGYYLDYQDGAEEARLGQMFEHTEGDE